MAFSLKLLISFGERAGARTQDPVIKSHVLYRLSYALPWPLDGFAQVDRHRLRSFREACLAATLTRVAGKTGRLFPDHALGPRCVG